MARYHARRHIAVFLVACCAVVSLCGVTSMVAVQQGVLTPPVGSVQVEPFMVHALITDHPDCAPFPSCFQRVPPNSPDYYVLWVLTVREEPMGHSIATQRVFALPLQ